MSYLELPHLFAAATNIAGNTAGVVTALGVGVEADGPEVARLPSFSQLLQGGAAARLEVGTDVVAFVASETVDYGAGLWRVGDVRLPTAERATVDSAILTQAGADPQIAVLALTFGTAAPVVGKGEAGSREKVIAELDPDSDQDVRDAEVAEAIWPGMALFMDSRAALQGLNAAKFEPSAPPVMTGTDAAGDVIRARIGAGPTLAPVLVAGDPFGSGATVADTVGLTLTGSSTSLLASADAVVGMANEGGDFKSSLANLTPGTLFGGRRALPDSAVVNTPPPLSTDSPESPLPVVESASPSLLSPVRFAVQDVARPMVPPTERLDVDPVMARSPMATTPTASAIDRPVLVPSAVTPPVTETVKAVPVAAAVERLDTTPAVAKTAIATPAVPPVEQPERVPSAVTPPVAETVKAVPVAAAVERLDTTPAVAKTAIATPAVPPEQPPERVPSAVSPSVAETVKAVPVAAAVERLDTTPAVAKTAIATPAVPPVEQPEQVPSAVTSPVAETVKAVPVAAAVERLDTTPVVAKTAIATPAVPPVERVDLAPMEITTPVAAAVERSDSALPVAKMPAATFVIPPVDRLNQAPMAVITPVAETVSGLATVTMAMPVADMAKKVSAGQQDRTPVRLDAPSMTLSSAISASTATEVTAVAGAEIDAALQDNVAPKPSASQTMGGRPFQPRLADPFNVIEPVATVETDSAVQVLAGEAQPVSVPVTTTGPSTTRSDPSATSTIHDSPSLVAAAAPIRPQSVHGVDAENPQLEKLSAEPVVIRAAEPTAPASGSAINSPASVASVASSRPEAVTAPTFTQTTSDTLDLQQSNWGRTLGHQLNWMINNRMQEAQIRVNPPDLGPIEVRMSMQQNHTNVTFLCHEAAVREAIENALPRLREMLNSQGILLNQAQVSDQSLARQQSGFGEQPYSRRESGSETATPDRNPAADAGEPPLRPRRSLGIVDHYV